MRQGWVWAVLGAVVMSAASCAKPAKAEVREDVLVLEVGGEQGSLRESLRALGRDVAPPKRLRPAEPDPEPPVRRQPSVPQVEGPPGQDPQGDEPREQPSRSSPDPEPQAEPEWLVVELKKGETLIHVARRYLGSSNRYGEIMEWNGFQPAQVKRLQVGHPIKLKRSELK